MSDAALMEGLRRQQIALAKFGAFAFHEADLQAILTEATRICADCLQVRFSKVCRYRPEENDLLIVAGCGWNAGVVGHVVSRADETTTQGRAFVTGEPVILEDVALNRSLVLPAFYAEHGIVSTADVLIKGKAGPWGVLEVDSPHHREFDEHDLVFLTGFANVLAEAVSTSERTAALQTAVERMKQLIAEKDQLLGERASHELKVRELQQGLIQVSRLNAMGQMTAAIAHELNQPLSAITNYTSAAKRFLDAEVVDPALILRLKELIEKVRGQTSRAGSIIKNLKDVVEKRECLRFAVTIESVIRDSLAMVMYDDTDCSVTTKLELDCAVPAVLIDKVQIQQILINLIRNSVEAMRDAPVRFLTLTAQAGAAGFVDVLVRDTGPGLAHDVVQRLFQPFNTTKPSGMGLGLMVCQMLAEANGGRIWRGNETAGTCFCLSLPIAPMGRELV